MKEYLLKVKVLDSTDIEDLIAKIDSLGGVLGCFEAAADYSDDEDEELGIDFAMNNRVFERESVVGFFDLED